MIIGGLMSLICFILSFNKVETLTSFINEISQIDDELYGISEKVKINYTGSFTYQMKLVTSGIGLFLFVGLFDYYVFSGWDLLTISLILLLIHGNNFVLC